MNRTIAAERARLQITQKELAEHLGVSQRTMYSWEQEPETIPGWALAKMAELFGVSTDYLLGR
jgi:DNA-binding XRE family transcriptional regulator